MSAARSQSPLSDCQSSDDCLGPLAVDMARLSSMVSCPIVAADDINESSLMAFIVSKFHSTPVRQNFWVLLGKICQFFAELAALTEGIGVQLWRLSIAGTHIQVGQSFDLDIGTSFSALELQRF